MIVQIDNPRELPALRGKYGVRLKKDGRRVLIHIHDEDAGGYWPEPVWVDRRSVRVVAGAEARELAAFMVEKRKAWVR